MPGLLKSFQIRALPGLYDNPIPSRFLALMNKERQPPCRKCEPLNDWHHTINMLQKPMTPSISH